MELPQVTVSLGVAGYPEDGDDLENLIQKADIALYHAKREGRNRVAAYRSGLNMPPPEA